MSLRTADREVDPCFKCRLCGTKPYIETDQDDDEAADKRLRLLVSASPSQRQLTRTPDPANPSANLNWMTSDFCANCADVIEYAYRWDIDDEDGVLHEFKDKEGKLVKHIESIPEQLEDFLKRKLDYNSAQTCLRLGNSHAQSMGRGTHVTIDSGKDNEEVLYEFDHYKTSHYEQYFKRKVSDKLPAGHVKQTYRGAAGVAVYKRVPGQCTRVRCVDARPAISCFDHSTLCVGGGVLSINVCVCPSIRYSSNSKSVMNVSCSIRACAGTDGATQDRVRRINDQ